MRTTILEIFSIAFAIAGLFCLYQIHGKISDSSFNDIYHIWDKSYPACISTCCAFISKKKWKQWMWGIFSTLSFLRVEQALVIDNRYDYGLGIVFIVVDSAFIAFVIVKIIWGIVKTKQE